MSCCGKIIRKAAGVAGKAAQVSEGYFWTLVERCFVLPVERYVFAESRRRACRRCRTVTWMTVAEYGRWILKEVGLVRAVTEFEKMETWPLLPQQPHAPGRKLMCRVCKCWIPAKSCVEKAACPEGKWSSVNSEQESIEQ